MKDCVCQLFSSSCRSKSRLAKAAGAEPARRMNKYTPLWREARFQVLWREAHGQVKTVKKLTVSDYFWKMRCGNSARDCGAKHMSK